MMMIMIALALYLQKGYRDISDTKALTFFQNNLALNTADVTDGKPIVVLSQSISGMSDFGRLVNFYDIHGRKREVLSFCSVLDTTREDYYYYLVKG
jgi:hypothetical protein